MKQTILLIILINMANAGISQGNRTILLEVKNPLTGKIEKIRQEDAK